MQSLNLIPADCLERAVRQRRLRLWMSVSAVAVVVIAVAGIQRWTASQAITQLQARLAAVRARQNNLDRALVLASKNHAGLLKQAAAVAALPQDHALVMQLTELAQTAPPGVVLTRITYQRPAAEPDPKVHRRSGQRRRPQRGAAAARREATISMAGYAADRAELEALLRAIQAVPHWERARLLRAAREPYLSTQAIAFELTCSAPEDRP